MYEGDIREVAGYQHSVVGYRYPLRESVGEMVIHLNRLATFTRHDQERSYAVPASVYSAAGEVVRKSPIVSPGISVQTSNGGSCTST